MGGGSPGLPARSVLGARLEVGGRLAGYLLLGSVAQDAYRPDDEELLELAGLLLASRVAAFRPSEFSVGAEREPQIITPTPDAAKARMARVTVSGLPQTMSSGLRAIAPLGFLAKKASASDLACWSVSATCTAFPIVDHSLANLIVSASWPELASIAW